jgi:multidrug resistance efflux pump
MPVSVCHEQPVTRTVIDPPREPAWAERKRSKRRVLIAVLYITLAMALAGAASFAALQHLTILPLDTAITTLPQTSIIAGEPGRVGEIYVNEGDRVVAGQPLFRIDSEAAAKEVEELRRAVRTAEIELASAESRRDGEESKRRMHESISRNQLEIADARIRALEVQRELAGAELRRLTQLFEHGLTSRSLFEAQQALVKEKEALLLQAQGERRIAESSVQTTGAGLFFSGNYLVGNLTETVAECRAAEERLKVAQSALSEALGRDTWRVYRAPFGGVVGAATKPVGIAVERGTEVLLLRPPAGPVYVDALLTAAEATQVRAGMQGTGFVPATGKTYPLTVVSVESRPQDSRLFARLAPTGVTSDDTRIFEPNLAVQVRLKKPLM